MVLPHVTAFVLAALPSPPARVLEVGAGSGELAAALREAGYDVVAIDPASDAPGVRSVALHELDEPAESFDAVVAAVSLHHVEPLAESIQRLALLIRPGGTLVVDELDVERFDDRAERWWLEHREADDHRHLSDVQDRVREMRAHLHTLERLRTALGEWFELGEPVRGAYLHRWGVPPGLREVEEQLIATGRLPATGARLVGIRRTEVRP